MDEKKNSKLGIASFITSIVAGINIFILFLTAGMMETSTPGGIDSESIVSVVLCPFGKHA